MWAWLQEHQSGVHYLAALLWGVGVASGFDDGGAFCVGQIAGVRVLDRLHFRESRIFPGVGWGKAAGKASCGATECIRWPRCRDLGRKEGEDRLRKSFVWGTHRLGDQFGVPFSSGPQPVRTDVNVDG